MSRKTMKKSLHQSLKMLAVALLLATIIQMGCVKAVQNFFKTDKDRFLGPDKLIHSTDTSPISPILETASDADPVEDILPNAEFPQESDYIYNDSDYVVGPSDVLDIGILDLYQPGMETTVRRQIEDSGYIDLPLLPDRILADRLTAQDLKARIATAYSQLLNNPQISVSIVARRQSSFSILGSVLSPGAYQIERSDMRLLDAIALSRGITAPSSTVRYIYIIRPEPPIAASEVEGGAAMLMPGPGLAPELPGTVDPEGGLPDVLPELELPFGDDNGDEVDDDEQLAPEPDGDTPGDDELSLVEMEGGTVSMIDAADDDEELVTTVEDDFVVEDPWGWEQSNKSDLARVIAINMKELLRGDPRMNVIIRDNDIIHVPTVEAGEFYIMGEVTRPGVYSLTGRRLTVKMAIAAAGNLGPLAWPENTILIRRIGENQEQIIPINVEAIFTGEDSDLFLKGNDVIAVGTNAAASFMAVVRNAFRMTYGFGFIYDRNFADPYPALGLDSKRFTRW